MPVRRTSPPWAVVSLVVFISSRPSQLRELLFERRLFLGAQRAEGTGLGLHGLVGEDQRVVRRVLVQLGELVLHSLDRADEVDVGGEFGGRFRLEVVVDE